jgi:flagellar hook-length control protein FliK
VTAVALAGTLLAAPTAGAAAVRSGRDSGARFGEVLDAAGLALDGAEDMTADHASPGEDEAIPAEEGRDATVSLAATLLTVTQAPAPSGSVAPTETGESVGEEAELEAMPSAATPSLSAQPEPETAAQPTPVTADGPAASPGAQSIPSPQVSAPSSTAAALSQESAAVGDGRRVAGASTTSTPGVAAGASPADGPADGPALASTGPVPTGFVAAVSASGARPTDPRASSPTASAPVAVASASAPVAPAPATAAPAPVDDAAPASAVPSPATSAAAPVVPQASATPAEAPAPVTHTTRAVAAQVSPVVVSIAQRPSGTHQLTMTVNPDSLGPVTVRAHIGQGGDVRVELIGATDAGRDALRAIVTDLRRDLAAAMPHATLSIAQGAGAEAGADRGGQAFTGGAGEQGASDRGAAGDTHGAPVSPEATASDPARSSAMTTTASAPGSGLDILA